MLIWDDFIVLQGFMGSQAQIVGQNEKRERFFLALYSVAIRFASAERSSTMTPPKNRNLSNPVMTRMDSSMRIDLEAIAKANGLNISDIVRLAISRQLPALKRGKISLFPVPTSK